MKTRTTEEDVKKLRRENISDELSSVENEEISSVSSQYCHSKNEIESSENSISKNDNSSSNLNETENEESSSLMEDLSYENDSDASYIYSSGQNDSSSDSINTEDERDFFGDSVSESDTEDSGVAWIDSDDDIGLREEYQSAATWLNSEGLTKNIQKENKRINFKYNSKAFMAKCSIKIFKAFEDFFIAVDKFNLVYFMTSFDDFKIYKIEYFRISDCVYFGNRILLSSDTSCFIKELTREGTVNNIKKNIGKIKKMSVGKRLFIISDKLYALDSNLTVKDEFNCEFVDICSNKQNAICLKDNGDIYVFDFQLNLKKRVSLQNKFEFKRIFCTESFVFVSSETGVYILDSAFNEIKYLNNIQKEITGFASNSDFIVHGSEYQNSLKIIKNGLIYHNRFPFSKVRISPISTLDMLKDTVYLCHGRYISTLKLYYS